MARRPNNATAARGHMGIRSRLMLLLVVPLVGLLAVGGYAMYNAVLQSRDAAELGGNAEVSLAAFGLVDALQAEREVLAQGKPTTEALRSAVTDASSELRSKANAQGGELKALSERALLRADAAGSLAQSGTGGLVAVDGYSPAIAALLMVSEAGFDPHGAIDNGPASATDLLASAQEAGARERDLVRALSERNQLVPDVYSQVSQLAAAQDIQSTQAAAVADENLTVRIDRIGDALAAASRGRDELFFGSVNGAVADQAAVDTWIVGADQRVANLLSLRNDAATRAVDAVDSLATSSRQVLLLAGGALIAMILISAFLVRSAIRSIARPLTELAAQAEEVALVRLPEAVKSQQTGGTDQRLPTLRATGASEVQEVADAFNDVQDTALRLAGEQAVLRRNLSDALTNLGRRNQALLGRQLDFITSLEQRETDPAFLEHLFKLDHLASRMRRNAESLLILTGSETPRRRRKPAALSEVVRAAMSEVEDFERVRMGSLGDATVTGPVVIDLVHMLAELVENSLRFSPPDSTGGSACMRSPRPTQRRSSTTSPR
ncbi:MAG TPA: HAMP domain-containing protein [Microthrixaceae bacterium]|nr:HAMP domain-containing protein [Microthrixaceae bacterium]